MKKFFGVLVSLVLILSLLTACSGKVADKPAFSPEIPVVKETPKSQPEAPIETEGLEPDVETGATKAPAKLDIEAQDSNLFNTKENAVPFGQWVYYQAPNHTSNKYEPIYVRIIGVSRDQAEVQAAIDAYEGIMDFTLSEKQAKDIEFGIVEYEIYYAPDYPASEHGINVLSVSLGAEPKGERFETDGKMFFGIGSAYDLNINGSSFYAKPGDVVREKSLFTILKNYDESEYLFSIDWYDGEIVTEKARTFYLAAK